MRTATAPLIPPRFLFRFELPVQAWKGTWKDKVGQLGTEHEIIPLASLEKGRKYATLRLGWHSSGLLFEVDVVGKHQFPWCRDSRLADSDGLQIWIDTRPADQVHRATRFCHRFVFLPTGGGRRADQPLADQLLIEQARENARPVRPDDLKAASKAAKNGYRLTCFVPASALTGYDPAEQSRLGINLAVNDRELGLQSLAVGEPFAQTSDPSLWVQAVLVD